MILFLALIFMALGARLSSTIARKKGRDAALYGVMGALFPLPTVLVALCVSNKTAVAS